MVDDTLHLLLASDNGTTLWHAIRDGNGTWSGFSDTAQAMRHQGTVVSVAATGVNGEFQATMVDTSGMVWHTIRHPDRTWDQANDIRLNAVFNLPTHVLEAAMAGG